MYADIVTGCWSPFNIVHLYTDYTMSETNFAGKNLYTKRQFQVVERAVCKAPVDQSVGIPKGGIPNIRHSHVDHTFDTL